MTLLRKIVSSLLTLIILGNTAACGEAGGVQSLTTEDTMEFIEYMREDLGVDLSEYLDAGEGEITDEPYAYLRFPVSDRGKLEEALNEVCGEPLGLTEEEIPGYMGHEIAKKLASEKLVNAWNYFMSGQNGAKTRTVEIYLTQGEGETFCLYYFG